MKEIISQLQNHETSKLFWQIIFQSSAQSCVQVADGQTLSAQLSGHHWRQKEGLMKIILYPDFYFRKCRNTKKILIHTIVT